MLYWMLSKQISQESRRNKLFWVKTVAIFLFVAWIVGSMLFIMITAKAQLPNSNSYHLLEKSIAPFFLGDLLIRYNIQSINTFNAYPYLCINVPKKSLITFAVVRSYINIYNLISLCLLLSFAFIFVQPVFVSFIPIAILVVLISNALNFLIKQLSYKYGVLHVCYPVFLMGLLYIFLNAGIITNDVKLLPDRLFLTLPGLAILIPIFVLLLLLQRKFIKHLFYYPNEKKSFFKINAWLYKPTSDNETLHWVILELKLIFRNAKPKGLMYSFVFLSLISIGLWQYIGSFNDYVFLIVVLGFSTVVAFAYGIFSISWNSSHFDFILLQPVSLQAFLKAKWIVIVLCAFFMLLVPVLWFLNRDHARLIKVLYFSLYVLACPPLITLFFSIHYYRKNNLQLGGYAANFDGRSWKHLLPEFIYFAIPLGILAICQFYGKPDAAFKSMALLGLLAAFSTKYCLLFLTKKLMKERYKIISKFKDV